MIIFNNELVDIDPDRDVFLETSIEPLFEFEEDFKWYVFAQENFELMRRHQKQVIQQLYADIHPTRLVYDTVYGKVYTESASVENHAIHIIDVKESHVKPLANLQYRLDLFTSACDILSEDERGLLQAYKDGSITEGSHELTSLMVKLRDEVERQEDYMQLLEA